MDPNQVHEGMVVRGSKGEKLGRVVSSAEGGFVFEKGFFSVTDHAARHADVTDIAGDTMCAVTARSAPSLCLQPSRSLPAPRASPR